MARPDAPVFTVMDLSVAVARAQFPEERTGDLRIGQECRFASVDAPDLARPGKVTVVSQAVDPLRRTVEVWCEISNGGGAVKAGAFGVVAIITGIHQGAVTVPSEAVQLDPDRKAGVVWTVGADGLAHENHVTTGVISPTSVEIREGVAKGQTVVVEGGYGLSEGVTVRQTESR
jgi:membrane fusion protein (multidrug efflux system)